MRRRCSGTSRCGRHTSAGTSGPDRVKPRRILGASLVVAALLASACSGDDSPAAPPSTDLVVPTIPDRGNVDGVLKIGYLLPTSGDAANVGPPMISGIEMAIRDINAAGGVNGQPVSLVGGRRRLRRVGHRRRGRSAAQLREGRRAHRPGIVDHRTERPWAHHRRRRARLLAVEHRTRARAVPRRRVLRAHRPVRSSAGRRARRGDRRRRLPHRRAHEPERRLRPGHGRRARRRAARERHPGDHQLRLRPERHELRPRRPAGARDRP